MSTAILESIAKMASTLLKENAMLFTLVQMVFNLTTNTVPTDFYSIPKSTSVTGRRMSPVMDLAALNFAERMAVGSMNAVKNVNQPNQHQPQQQPLPLQQRQLPQPPLATL